MEINDDYHDFTADELLDEIKGLDKEIESCQTQLARTRKAMNVKMDLRESLLDLYKEKAQKGRWKK